MRRGTIALALVLVCVPPGTAAAAAMGNPDVAALQVALRARGVYSGTVDGFAGPQTRTAVRRLQRHSGLTADGIAGPATRRAIGRLGRPAVGGRLIRTGAQGWDVSALQFLLAWHGFPSGPMDGGFGTRTEAAVRRFQRWAGTTADGAVGAGTVTALRRPPRHSPLRLLRPVSAAVGDRFGPRAARFHTGVDFTSAYGAPVRAAAGGRVTWAGWRDGGWGNLVSIAHGGGVRTMYAHLSRIRVARGHRVAAGALVGDVGTTGVAFGPHLHFELRLRGASLDPLTGL
jgi:murein DD-endopeptidase MepM/ murein hydrolase activator NlpD